MLGCGRTQGFQIREDLFDFIVADGRRRDWRHLAAALADLGDQFIELHVERYQSRTGVAASVFSVAHLADSIERNFSRRWFGLTSHRHTREQHDTETEQERTHQNPNIWKRKKRLRRRRKAGHHVLREGKN